jgi:8-oxo-dGTP pyrophosphatase MutT (NUDIX family)
MGYEMGNIFTLTALGASKALALPNLYRQQAAAVCFRREGDETEVLLITGRDHGRWGIPKGTI